MKIKAEVPGFEEFKEELVKDRDFVDRYIVRAVIRKTPIKEMPYMYHYTVELTTVIDAYGKARILEAGIYCGQTWKDNTGKTIDGDGEEKATQKLEEVTKILKDLGFDVRSGRFSAAT